MERIKIYASPTCIYCKKAKELLDTNGVAYEEIDVSTENGLKQLSDLGFNSVPVLIINSEKTIKGFDEQKIMGTLFEK